MRRDFLAFVDEHGSGALDRDLRAGHLTASTVLLDDARERVMLTLHPLAGRWFQLGGHLEPDDPTIEAAAAREAREESGIGAIHAVDGPIGLERHPTRCRDRAGNPAASSHLDLQFVAVAPPGAIPRRSQESIDLAWFPLDVLPDGADPAVRSLVERVRRLGFA